MVASIVAVWVFAYVVTNLDDHLLLILFFAHPEYRARNIVLAEYLGIATLFAGSLVVARGTVFLPEAWVGLLGLVPILIGVRSLCGENSFVDADPSSGPAQETESRWTKALPEPTFVPRDFSVVWLVTVANGGDNLAVYVPLFRTQAFGHLPIVAAVFVVLIGIWCVLGWYAGRRPVVGRVIRTYSDRLLPYTLIGLGVYVLVTSGSPALFW